MRLIQSVDKSFGYKKKYSLIRPLFQDLGAVRETQLQEQKLNEVGKILKPGFTRKYHRLLDEELTERENTALKYSDHSVIKAFKKVEKQVKQAVKNLKHNDFKKYFKARILKLKKSFDAFDFTENQMHAVRGLIKEIKFNTRFKQKMVEKWLAKRGLDLALLDDLQNFQLT